MLIRIPIPIRELVCRSLLAVSALALVLLTGCLSLSPGEPLTESVDDLVRQLLPEGKEIAAPIAVGDFLLSGFPTDVGEEIALALPASLAENDPDLDVIASRDLDRVLGAQKLQMSDLFSGPGPRPGQLLPARSLVTGFLFQQGGADVRVEARIIDLESGKVVSAASTSISGRRAEVIDRYAQIPLEVAFHVLSRQRDREGEIVVSEGTELYSGDLVRIRVKPNRPANLYVFLLDTQGCARLLHPSSSGASTRVEAGLLLVPENGGYFRLDRHPGRESLLVVASIEPLEELDSILGELDQLAAGSREVMGRLESLGLRGFVGISDSSGGLENSLGEVMRTYSGSVWSLVSFDHKP